MDLLQTVRKEGSRGGVNFSWDDVKSSAHRENYLGHSLKAPVGRWQRNRDLGWYAKGDDADESSEQRIAREKEAKREELRKVKEAEEDAMARALGLPVPERNGEGNANLVPLGLEKGKMEKALNDDADEERRGRGIGGRGGVQDDGGNEVLEGSRTRVERHKRHEHRRSECHHSEDRRPHSHGVVEDEYRSAKRRRHSRSIDHDPERRRHRRRDSRDGRRTSPEPRRHRSRLRSQSVEREPRDSYRRRNNYGEPSRAKDDERRTQRRRRSRSKRRRSSSRVRSRSRSPHRRSRG